MLSETFAAAGSGDFRAPWMRSQVCYVLASSGRGNALWHCGLSSLLQPRHGFRYNTLRVVKACRALRKLDILHDRTVLAFAWPSHKGKQSYTKARRRPSRLALHVAEVSAGMAGWASGRSCLPPSQARKRRKQLIGLGCCCSSSRTCAALWSFWLIVWDAG